MPVNLLAIHRLRNIQSADLTFSPTLNIVYGKNGSGKTTVLEALHFLGLGRSFRTRENKPLIPYGEQQLSLFSRLSSPLQDEVTIGIQRSTRSSINKTLIDSIPASSATQLAGVLPVKVICSQSFQLLEGSPSVRRSYLDWAMFHVKHDFSSLWREYARCLKQRNSLLRRGKMGGYEGLDHWSMALANLGSKIHQQRLEMYPGLSEAFNTLLQDFGFVGKVAIGFSYKRGWPDGLGLLESINRHLDTDKARGFTGVGPHKADLVFTVNGLPANSVLSRGQIKTLVCALNLAQLAYLQSKASAVRPILLIDDFTAELDMDSQRRIATWVERIQVQTFITGIDLNTLLQPWGSNVLAGAKMFHVKHGSFNEELFSGDLNDR